MGLFNRKSKKVAAAGNSNEAGYVSVVLEDNLESYVFGPFATVEEADDWDAPTRVAMSAMMNGDMYIMSGQVGILPADSSEVLKRIEKLGLIDPNSPDWGFIH